MKKIFFAAPLFIFASTFQSIAASDNPYASEYMGGRAHHGHSNKTDRVHGDHSGEVAQAAQGPKGDKGDRGLKGDKGEKGDRGEPGTTYTLVYGSYFQFNNATVEKGSAVIFDAPLKTNGGIEYNNENGTFTLPEDGDYQLTYTLHVDGSSTATFGVVVNDKHVLPGSVYRSTISIGSSQLAGSLIASFSKGDTIKIVNLSDDPFNLNNNESPLSNNATLLINKLN